MGSSTEHSAYGPTRNPWDVERIPGGSGGGSAAALASFEAPLAIGTDTGGSIRQPAAVTGTVGVKPTYGAVIATVSWRSPAAWIRPGRVPAPCSTRRCCTRSSPVTIRSTRPACPPPSRTSSVRPGTGTSRACASASSRSSTERTATRAQAGSGVRARFDEAVEALVDAGAKVTEVSCPSFTAALAAYYLILPSEASSNLAKFDAMRYGLRVYPEGVADPTAEQVMAATREVGFGDEVKRRIILGTYALSSGYYDAYYGSAQKVRTLVQRDFASAFEEADVLVSPTAPTTAFPLGSKIDDPLAMYLNDVATIPANLAGVPGMSLPSGLADEDGLPTGLQILAPANADDRLYRVGAALEAILLERWGGPLLDRASLRLRLDRWSPTARPKPLRIARRPTARSLGFQRWAAPSSLREPSEFAVAADRRDVAVVVNASDGRRISHDFRRTDRRTFRRPMSRRRSPPREATTSIPPLGDDSRCYTGQPR